MGLNEFPEKEGRKKRAEISCEKIMAQNVRILQ